MDGNDALRPEWLAFESELGFRPKLRGPTYDDIIQQDTHNGERLLARFKPEASESISPQTEWHQTATGVRLKSYCPPEAEAATRQKPLVYFVHGGGFVIGSVDQDDRFVNRHVQDTGCVFVSVEYRLAPQHKYPAALDDCVAGAKWCLANATILGANNGPIVIMGKSAGASLAGGVALKLIDEGLESAICGVVACQPLTIHPDAVEDSLRHRYTAYDDNAENTVNTKDAMLAFYTPLDDPYTWPLLHKSIDKLPCVYMNACGADTLRDDARLMRDLLDRLKVSNRYDEYDQLPHYFFAFPSVHLKESRNEYFAKTAKGIQWVVRNGLDTNNLHP